jgi:hypothetical protein
MNKRMRLKNNICLVLQELEQIYLVIVFFSELLDGTKAVGSRLHAAGCRRLFRWRQFPPLAGQGVDFGYFYIWEGILSYPA